MTIAACFLSSEGVVLGSDSTTTMFVAGPGGASGGMEHHFNFAQKIFQIGRDGSLGITMWGLGSLEPTSYRTLIAEFDDRLSQSPSASMQDIATAWSNHFWGAYSIAMSPFLGRARELAAKPNRTQEEEMELLEAVSKL